MTSQPCTPVTLGLLLAACKEMCRKADQYQTQEKSLFGPGVRAGEEAEGNNAATKLPPPRVPGATADQ